MRLFNVGIIAALGLLISGCGGGSGGEQKSPNPVPVPNPVPTPVPSLPPDLTPTPEPDKPHAQVRARFEALATNRLAALEGLDCKSEIQSTSELCMASKLRFSDGRFYAEKVDEDQTILFMDTGLSVKGTLVNRSRMQNMYQVQNGQLMAFDPEITVPRFLMETLQQFDQDPEFFHTGWMTSLADRLLEMGALPYPEDGLHGQIPFEIVASHNPRASFVYLRAPDFFWDKQALCTHDLQTLTEQHQQLANTIKNEILDKYQIEYVNWSGGYQTDSIDGLWNASCDTSLAKPSLAQKRDLENTLRPFYQVLFNSPGVLGVQSTHLNVHPSTHVLDSDDSFYNRVRVGGFTDMRDAASALPADGVIGNQAPPALEDIFQSGRAYVDLFVNFGFEGSREDFRDNGSPIMKTSSIGMAYYPLNHKATSWTAPAGLNRIIYIKNSLYPDQPLTDTLIQQIKDKLTPMGCTYHPEDQGRCKLQDPARYKQHELARLKYIQ